MYRILIATKRGKFEYENTYKWYSLKGEDGYIHIVYFETLEEAYEEVKKLLTDPNPAKDYSFHDLIIVKHENYDLDVSEGEDIGDVSTSL